jgi:hypothetical protein
MTKSPSKGSPKEVGEPLFPLDLEFIARYTKAPQPRVP